MKRRASSRRGVFLAGIPLALLAGACSPVTKKPEFLDPEATSFGVGGTDEIYQVVQKAVGDLLERHPQIAQGTAVRPTRIILDRIVNNTRIRGYDEKIVYNRFLAQLTRVAAGRFAVLNRNAVRAEREAQLSGEVEATGAPEKLAGADLVLTVELRTIAGVESETIQYYFQLTALDGTVIWTHEEIFKKRA